MKKRWVGIALAVSMCCTSMTAFAKNNTDTLLPNKYITFSYSSAAETGLRAKEDDSSHYVRNDSGFDLWVESMNASNRNRTHKLYAIVKGGEWSIYNDVYEMGDRSCKLSITTAVDGVSGYLKGVWSPDCYGYVRPANP